MKFNKIIARFVLAGMVISVMQPTYMQAFSWSGLKGVPKTCWNATKRVGAKIGRAGFSLGKKVARNKGKTSKLLFIAAAWSVFFYFLYKNVKQAQARRQSAEESWEERTSRQRDQQQYWEDFFNSFGDSSRNGSYSNTNSGANAEEFDEKAYRFMGLNPDNNPSWEDILGVDSHATQEKIDKAYRQMHRRYHPDKHIGRNNSIATEAAKILNHAKEAAYDDRMFA